MGGILGIGGRPQYLPAPVRFAPPVADTRPSETIQTQAPDPEPATTPSSTLTQLPTDGNDFASRMRAHDAAAKTDKGASASSILTGDDAATQTKRRKLLGEA